MELRPIKTELDYQNALKEIERLFDAALNLYIYFTSLMRSLIQPLYKLHSLPLLGIQ
jgi:antitoxin component HigA of HigAB toxin-antitoxin module